MKKLKLGKIQKIPKGLKKIFTYWSRRKIIILLLVVLAGGAGYLFYRQRAGADTFKVASANASNLIEVQLPKNLADKAKQQNDSAQKFSDAENSTIDGLVKKEMDKKASTTKSATTRQASISDSKKDNFQDAIVILKDENGKAILPDLEKLKSQSALSRAVTGVPESNKINFIIGGGWSPEEKQEIQSVIDNDVPKIRELLGPPLFNNNVILTKFNRSAVQLGYAGCYRTYENSISIANDVTINGELHGLRGILIHEISHAWRDDLILTVLLKNSPVYSLENMLAEEAISSFVATYMTELQWDKAPSINDYLFNTPSVNTQFVSLDSYFPYEYSWRVIAKLFIEDEKFLIKFHNQLYQRQYRVGGEPGLVKRLMKESLPPMIENIPAENWLDSQYLLFPNKEIKQGANFVIMPVNRYSPQILYYYVNKDESFNLYEDSANKIQITFYDVNGKITGKKRSIGMNYSTVSGAKQPIQLYNSYPPNSVKDGWTKIVVNDSYNNSYSFIWFFTRHFDERDRDLVLSDKVNVGKNGKIIFEAKTKKNKNLTQTEIIPLSKNFPNGEDGLFDKVGVNGASASWDTFAEFYVFSKYNLYYLCPLFAEQDKTYIGQTKYGDPDMVVYVNPTDELKNNTKPSITIKSAGQQKWTIATNEKSAVTATIINSRNQTIKTIVDKQIIDSQLPITWDGKDDSGKPAPKGLYTLNVLATDKLCLTSSSKTPFRLTATVTDTQTDTQKRDTQRLSDITTIKTALESYKKAKGSYPSTRGAKFPNSGWVNSNDNSWKKFETELKPYLPSGITSLPKDPINTSNAWAATSNAFTYAYFSLNYGKSSSCQWYMLVYRLDDARLKASPGAKACNGKQFQYGNRSITEGGDAVRSTDTQTDTQKRNDQRKADIHAKLKTFLKFLFKNQRSARFRRLDSDQRQRRIKR